MRRLLGEGGFSAAETLVAMSMMIGILGATLLPFEGFWKNERQNTQQNEAQDKARTALDRIARELRSGASASQLIEKAAATDLVFQVADPTTSPSGSNSTNIRRVRYCVDASSPPQLRRQTHSWTTATPPAMPATTACPGTGGWSSPASVVATNVANGGTALFSYDSGTAANVTNVEMRLLIDITPNAKPAATDLRTGVSLRNLNRAPTASFTAQATGNRHVSLNAQASNDPDGGSVTYRWCLVSGCAATDQIGTGVILDYQAASTGNLTIYLMVFDSAGMSAETSQAVTVT